MSGLSTATQLQQASVRPPGTENNSSADDAAASLRAAALLTLKSNRRKAHVGIELPSGLPPRPVTSDVSIELDYGTEEPAAGASSKPASVSAPVALPRPPLAPPPESMDVDEIQEESQGREEGEISDTESTPAPKSPQVLPRSVLPQPQSIVKSPAKDRPSQSPVPLPSIKLEVKAHPPPESRISPPIHLVHSSSYDNNPVLINEDHVRPGLAMNQVQYDTAKDIVLDLLGWGVPPEYLVDCGLSREIVYWVFAELNLRLPANLDLTGLPQLDNFSYTGSPEPMTPPPSRSPRQRSNSSAIRLGPPLRLVQGHPSLPQKPSAPQGTDDFGSQPHTLSSTATPFVPTASTSAVPMSAPESPPSLIDIEQQRRQELLARKAVLASRKSKLAAAANADTTVCRPTVVTQPETMDVEMASPAVPTETVDDFLSSIPAVGADTRSASFGDEMDVDTIPGLSMNGNGSSQSDLLSQRPLLASPTDLLTPSTSSQPPQSEASSSGQSTRDPSMERSAERGMSVDNRSDSSERQSRPPSLRRGTKRPVAADFVDMEPGSSRFQSRPDTPTNYSINYSPYVARKQRPQSFAGLASRTRRIVIDLSDSEDEIEDVVNGHLTVKHHHRRPPSRLGAAATVPQIRSPALLAEKEQEIKRMKELIAARERAIRGKMTVNSTRSTPPASVASRSSVPPATPVKEEEDEIAASASLKPTPAQDDHNVTPVPSTPVPLSATPSLAPSTSTSAPPTPIGSPSGSATLRFLTDYSSTDLTVSAKERPTTGDKVITAEARQEEVASFLSPAPHPAEVTYPEPNELISLSAVDVVGSEMETSSAQVAPLEAESKTKYSEYHSIMSMYPLLRLHSLYPHLSESRTVLKAVSPDGPPGSGASGVLPALDLKPVKALAIYNWLKDSSRFLCQYEVPGGGECRDHECKDIHPSRAWAVEPSDEETARYLCAVLPDSMHLNEEMLQTALQTVRLRQAHASLEARVSDALGSLGLQAAS